jgi:uncharacterized protein (TIGR00251 family)
VPRRDQAILEETKDGVVVSVHAQPGAGTTEVVGTHGASLKIRVAAPPTRNRANEALAELLADVFDLKVADVELTTGAASHQKRFRLTGIDLDAAERAVSSLVWADPSRAQRGLNPDSIDRP